jgi:hypothetical protein
MYTLKKNERRWRMAKRRTTKESRKFVLDALKYSNPKARSASKTEAFNTYSPWSKNNRDERTLAIDFCLLGSANSELKIQINNDFLKHLDQKTAGIIVKSLILYNSELMKLAAFLQQDEIFEKVIPHLLFSPTDFSQAKEMRKITDFMLKYFKPENLKKVLVKQFEGSNLTPKFVHLAVYKIHASSPKMVDEAMLSNIIRRAEFDPRKGISWLAQSWRSLVNWYCSRRHKPNAYHETKSLKNHMDALSTKTRGSANKTTPNSAKRRPRINMTPPPKMNTPKQPKAPSSTASDDTASSSKSVPKAVSSPRSGSSGRHNETEALINNLSPITDRSANSRTPDSLFHQQNTVDTSVQHLQIIPLQEGQLEAWEEITALVRAPKSSHPESENSSITSLNSSDVETDITSISSSEHSNLTSIIGSGSIASSEHSNLTSIIGSGSIASSEHSNSY